MNHHSPWPVLAAALAGAIAVAACNDPAVAPRESRAGPPVGSSPAADQQTSDPGGALTAALPGNDSRTGSGLVALGSLGAEPVLVQAVASGLLQMYAYGDTTQPPGYVDPNGIFLFTENSCKANVEVAGANGTYVRFCDGRNDNPLEETVTRYAILQGDVSAWRTGGPQPSFGPACDGIYGDGTPTGPCFTFKGQQTVTLTRVQATLSLEPNASEVPKGTDVTFTLALSPASMSDPFFGQVSQVNVPMRVTAQRWVPDAAPGLTGACSFWQPATCTLAIQESGRMEVDAIVQGTAMTVRARVQVVADSLMLTASPTSVKPGIKVTFTAKTKKGTPFTVNSWEYRVTPAPARQLTAVAACGSAKTCVTPVYETGEMIVTGTIQGETSPSSAAASVTIIPCPPDTSTLDQDPYMNDLGFRKDLTEALDRSKIGGKHELGGDAWTNANGNTALREIPSEFAPSPCFFQADSTAAPPPPPGSTRAKVDWHVHPHAPGVTYSGCTRPALGSYPEIKATDKLIAVAGPSLIGGDWTHATERGTTGFLIDGSGDIWRWNYPPNSFHTEYRRWKRDGQSACYTRGEVP